MNQVAMHWIRRGAHAVMLLPLLWIVYSLVTNQLGADPAEKLVRDLGFTGACLLWASLSMTPLRNLSGSGLWILLRRPIGLWSFFYLSLHLIAFLVFWAGLDVQIVLEELSERPYIYVGVSAWLVLVPLALTSTRASRRRLGQRWIQLHKLVYLSVVLALVHILWVSKLDYLQPGLFGLVLAVLFLLRIKKIKKGRQPF